MANKVQLEELNIHFGKTHAVKDVSIAFPENGVTAIIGPLGG